MYVYVFVESIFCFIDLFLSLYYQTILITVALNQNKCIRYISHCWDKIPDGRNFKKGDFNWLMVGGDWYIMLGDKAAGAWRVWENCWWWMLVHCSLFVFSPGLHSEGGGSSSSGMWKCPHGHSEVCLSRASVSNTVKYTD